MSHYKKIIGVVLFWLLSRSKKVTLVCDMSVLKKGWKELSFWHKFWFSNPYIFATWWCIQTIIMWSNRIHSLKYQRSPTLNCKDIGIGKSEFVAKTQFLCRYFCLIHKRWLFKNNVKLKLFLRNKHLNI